MKKFKRLSHIVSCSLALLMLLMPLQGVSAEESEPQAERQTIRVAFPTQEGMSFFGHSGKVTGYNYDYLEKISEYTGWEMEYVPYGSADGNEAVGNAISDLQEGKVDLLGPLLKNKATEEMFEFPKNSYGTVYTTLCAFLQQYPRKQHFQCRCTARRSVGSRRGTQRGSADVPEIRKSSL